jgi:hypothetical protein
MISVLARALALLLNRISSDVIPVAVSFSAVLVRDRVL